MRPWTRLAFLVVVLLALPRPAHAYGYGDTLTVIWKPLPNLPAILRPGDTLTVWAKAPAGAAAWSAALVLGNASWPLAPAGGGWQPSLGWWSLALAVPAPLPEELYDLAVSCDSCPPDTARHAVKVIPAFRRDFYFAQVSDTHLPEHTFSSGGSINTSDTTGMADFDAVIDDLNLIHPEFTLHSGDLVNEGELEEYLGMYEMGRAQGMIRRLRDPLFLSSGNHDIGGWTPTAPPAGTSRKDWWRYFGWPALANPPAGYPWHSQDYSFDYDLLHVIALEAYQNDGSYDNYLPALYGAQSMTAEQMSWLAADVAAVPAGRTKIAFFHYDFGGTLANGLAAPNFSQFANLPALGLDGVLWGHNHVVPEGDLAAHPFNLGLQSVIMNSSGGRTFRIFRVHDGAVTPGPMHHAGGLSPVPTDSLTTVWSGPDDGTRRALSATVTNRYGEAWEHARLVFVLADHDSAYAATNGTVAQVLRDAGVARVYVDCVVPAAGTLAVSVQPSAPAAVGPADSAGLRLAPPGPDPFVAGGGSLRVRFALPAAARASVRVYDLMGRVVADLFEGTAGAGEHALAWDGRADGVPVGAGLYFVRLASAAGVRQARFVVLR